MLSELEGAILLEVHLRHRRTAFEVRKVFLQSPTSDWSGSAGAIYPAIARLERNGLIVRTQTPDGRGTRILSLTKTGVDALHEWATSPDLATRITSDPFRTRVDYLKALPAPERRAALAQIRNAMTHLLAVIDEQISADNPAKTEANNLARDLLTARLDWLDAAKGRSRKPPG